MLLLLLKLVCWASWEDGEWEKRKGRAMTTIKVFSYCHFARYCTAQHDPVLLVDLKSLNLPLFSVPSCPYGHVDLSLEDKWDTVQDFWNYYLNPRELPLEKRFFRCLSPYLQENSGLNVTIYINSIYGNTCLFNLLSSSAQRNECHEKDGFVYFETWNWSWRAGFTWAKRHELPFPVSIFCRKQSPLLNFAPQRKQKWV